MIPSFDITDNPLLNNRIDEQTCLAAAHYFRLEGTIRLNNAFPRSTIEQLKDYFFEHYASQDPEEIQKQCLRVGDKRFMFTVRIEDVFADPDIYASPRVLPVVREILGPDCVIQSFGAVCAFPGSQMQHLHRDHPSLFAEAGGLNAFMPPFALHVVVPLVDLDESTGTTAVWPGTHRVKNSAQENRYQKDEMDALMGADLPYTRMGDCYFMDFRLRHRGTPNASDIPRPILYLVYSRAWFRDSRNYESKQQEPISISRAELQRVPEPLKPLFAQARPD
ncbi:MAG: phytanoyl-CoA dioxygenase family protein [Xanthomonadales bacterium]|nr:phytanoyl-CoA dioxygenase family protein [Xanthomonadales bacterium]